MASIFGIFLVRQFARGIPDELLEVARIDGAGELRIFTTVIVPLLKPIVATLAVFSFLGTWNDFMWPLIVLTDDSLHTLPSPLRAVARARAGQRADDGRVGDHGAAGAAALSRPCSASTWKGLLAGSVKG
jgi:ABC-type glycerol-3-phosphate transport system permease component